MSLILDALRKLDREKAANAGKRDISAEILKPGDAPGRNGMLALLIALGVAASVAALVTSFVIGGSAPSKSDKTPTAPASPVQTGRTAPVPSVPASVEMATAPKAPAPSAPSETAASAGQPGRAAEDGKPAAAKGRPSGKQDISAKSTLRSAESPASRPSVKISAIVWQEEPSERKATINGRVARQGEFVDGMKVLEIHPSHVKVSFEGKAFTVGMFD